MKVKRLKHARKILAFYNRHFDVHKPYQVLVDGTFAQVALKSKIYIKEQLPKYLDGPVQLVTTSCVLSEVKSLGVELLGATLVLKRFQQRRCSHGSKPIPAIDCIRSLLGAENPHHYLVATQDVELKQSLREVAGVPIVHICHNAITIDSPSVASKRQANEVARSDSRLSRHERETLEQLKRALPHEEQRRTRGRRRRPQGPNPLSVKRKKETMKVVKNPDKRKKTRRKPKRLGKNAD
ncbi:rRNA-processing protein UTP23 homolog [Corticium candelabrum]|uniref:rRNA-processing protein UTP23 homolog n=1 Tax=Corticium candelabrum TaxID=121492 RepID=UPI002E2532F1|nr:rRNA-processing protein UTP23 homolog [Corticium candelabrum]XP_062522275.1 rRNA-processing protein UTP23 homolog [Corticium candelabrum]XP_062522276.1 rRNA-processing protein UTP23 homolog [Corticium candelabrum]